MPTWLETYQVNSPACKPRAENVLEIRLFYLSNVIVLTTAHGHVIIIQRMHIEITTLMIIIISPFDPIWMSVKIKGIYVFRGCQIGMQGLQLFAKPSHFCKLDVATSRMAFLDLNLHVLQVATSNSNNWGHSVVQHCTSNTPYKIYCTKYYILTIHTHFCCID